MPVKASLAGAFAFLDRLSGGGGAAAREESLEDVVAREPSAAKRFFKILGPGLVTGASDDDPSGIGTYAMAGASLGYGPLWMAWLTFPLMTAIQFICAKVGLVSGMGIAGVLRRHYPPALLYAAVAGLMVANTINAGADILAIAAGVNLLVPVPTYLLIAPLGIAILAIQILGSYRLIAKVFKWLTLSLFAYIVASFLAHPDWQAVLRGTLVPSVSFDGQFLSILVAILGTTISPYLFFWQANQEVEEEVARGRTLRSQRLGASDAQIKYAAWDVITGMLFSNLVMYFIILATAATLHAAGQTHIDTATQAAEALRPLAGNACYVLMALGLIGTGLLAVPILTASAAYAVCEAFGWRASLDAKPGRARQFYLVIITATLAALVIDYLGVSAMKALFLTAVLNGFLAPPLLVLIMLVSSNRKVMGWRVNGPMLKVFGWVTAIIMFAAALGLVATWGAS
jgi:NRAMP (natural resistance-associated macrophage protein)-like metal ion transporter